MAIHRETQVKVNAFVDEGIAELVEALSAIDGLVTVESCQGDVEAEAAAFVLFRMADWQRLGEFLFEALHPAMQPDLRNMVMLRITSYGRGSALGSIDCSPRAIAPLVRCVRDLATAVGQRAAMAGVAHRDAVAESIGTASCL